MCRFAAEAFVAVTSPVGAEPARRAVAIRARLDAATPGPWREMCMGSEGYHVYEDVSTTGKLRRKLTARCTYEDWETDKANASLIANAPADLAWLLDALAAAEARAAQAEQALADTRGKIAAVRSDYMNGNVPNMREFIARLDAALAASSGSVTGEQQQ